MRVRIAKIVGFLLVTIWLFGCMTGDGILRSKETVLKDDLFTLRHTIDEFTRDKKRAPQSLEELVQAGYLRQIPKDPMTNEPNWEPVMETDVLSEGVEIGIADIHSSSRQMSTEGTAYSSW
jgi:general secretion pathway protein G